MTVTIGIVFSQVYLHEIVNNREDQEAYAIEMTLAVLIVPICVTAYFMSVHREAKYKHMIVSLA